MLERGKLDRGIIEVEETFVTSSHLKAVPYPTTNRDEHRDHRSDPKVCAHCSARHLCTHSKDCVKTVQRHIRKDYEELAAREACHALYTLQRPPPGYKLGEA